ncbi:hypothetical protein ASZ90_019659 [hydrocarbon metagenome]|uniref:Uncharacterized protein n=1 Tax=hydrocarbon metagenome TaxID=938273 RepID=A0A0W8E2R8_9ZZZZ
MVTVKEVGYLEFKKLLQARYGKNWMQWIMGICPDGILIEELILMVDLDETAQKLGWIRIAEKKHIHEPQRKIGCE